MYFAANKTKSISRKGLFPVSYLLNFTQFGPMAVSIFHLRRCFEAMGCHLISLERHHLPVIYFILQITRWFQVCGHRYSQCWMGKYPVCTMLNLVKKTIEKTKSCSLILCLIYANNKLIYKR